MNWFLESITYQHLIILLLAYLLGAIPNSVWIGKLFFNTDVRKQGSGNAGATNSMRILGWKIGILVLVLDALKGFAAVKLSYLIPHQEWNAEQFAAFQLLLANLALIGHVFPVYIKFKGGKGMACLIGAGIALYPLPLLFSLVVFILVILITKYVSLSSIISAIAFPFFVIFVTKNDIVSLQVFSVVVAVFVPVTHIENIKRLISGQESKIKFNKNK